MLNQIRPINDSEFFVASNAAVAPSDFHEVGSSMVNISRLDDNILTAGLNILSSSDSAIFYDNWSLVSGEIEASSSETWALQLGTLRLTCSETTAKSSVIFRVDGTEMLPVLAGERYFLELFTSLHRCRGIIELSQFDSTGCLIGTLTIPLFPTDKRGGKAIDGYDRVRSEVLILEHAKTLSITVAAHSFNLSKKHIYPKGFLFFTFPALWHCPDSLEWCDHYNADSTSLVTQTQDYVGRRLYRVRETIVEKESSANKPKALFTPNAAEKGMQKNNSVRIVVLSGSFLEIEFSVTFQQTVIIVSGSKLLAVATIYPKNERQYIKLPSSVFDHQEKSITLISPDLKILDERVFFFSHTLLDYEQMRQHCRARISSSLSPIARYLNEFQVALIDKLLPGCSSSEILELRRCIGILTDGPQLPLGSLFRFDTPDNPIVSVIIPVKDNILYTVRCLAAVRLCSDETSLEVILIDDGSSDATRTIEHTIEGLKVVRNKESVGFVGACNAGSRIANGKYLFFLNNDALVSRGAIASLLKTFYEFEQVGAVGAKLIFPDGKLQDAGGIVRSSGKPENFGRGNNPFEPRFNFVREADYLSGAAILVNREVFIGVGRFSEEYAPAYYEDTDLSFKIRDLGYRTLFQPKSVVIHIEGVSNGTDASSGSNLKRYQSINQPKFEKKWSSAFASFGGESEDAGSLIYRRSIGRVLVVDYQLPRYDVDAGSYAAIQEIRLIQSLGYHVTFLPLNLGFLEPYANVLERMGVEVIYAPFASSVADFIRSTQGCYDLVYATRYYVFNEIADLVDLYLPDVPTILVLADLHFLREQRVFERTGDPRDREKYLATKAKELRAISKAYLTLSYSTAEKQILESLDLEGANVEICPWVVETDPLISGFRERSGISFLGGYGHPPNIEAVEYFLSNIQPLLKHKMPDLVTHIYGSKMPEHWYNMNIEGVVFEGAVESVSSVYNNHKVFIAPMLTGAGVKGKVFGAAAAGCPMILSPVAAEGIRLDPEKSFKLAQHPEEWVSSIQELTTSESAWSDYSRQARDSMIQNYGFQNGRSQMAKMFKKLGMSIRDEKQNIFPVSLKSIF